MDIRSPLDLANVQSPQFGPPIVPTVTELPPHKMQAVMRRIYGEDSAETVPDADENLSPPEIVAKMGKLAYLAAQFGPELLDVAIATVRAVKSGMLTTQIEQAPRGLSVPLDTGMGTPPMPPQPPTSRQFIPSPLME